MISRKIGRYEVKKWLGGGRFGDVYLVYDPLMGKELAIKLIRTTVNSVKDALSEVKILSELIHRNIVRFYTVEKFEGKIGILTEYVKGVSLRNYIKKYAPLEFDKALSIAKEIADALIYAHSKGIIHRDIKPENIVVTEDGLVKLLDFGLSLFFTDELTRSIAGTPSYMAPECWEGRFYRESDYFSLGVILYELLTGINPFMSPSLDETKRKIIKFSSKNLNKINSSDIKEIVSQLLSKNREKRRKGIEEFLETYEDKEGFSKVTVSQFKILSDEGREYPLSEEQERIVSASSKKILTVGGAGSGKTYTLIGKLLSLVFKEKISPERIIVLTFTQRNSAEIERKILKVSKRLSSSLWMGTFHNLAFRFVNSYLEILGLSSPFTLITPSMQRKILRNAFLAEGDSSGIDPSDVSEFITIERSKIEPFLGVENTRFVLFSKKVYEHYMRYLKEKGIVDYDELLRKFYILLKETEPGKRIKKFFKAILVDEFQDLTEIQIEILKLLSEGEVLFATGDPEQNIYEWRGTKKDVRETFSKTFPDGVIFNLSKSFRLPPEILSPSRNLISHNDDSGSELLWTSKKEGSGSFSIIGFRTKKEQASKIAASIKRLSTEKGYTFDDFAVIYRMNSSSRAFEEEFTRKDIPYILPNSQSFYKRDEIDKIIKFIKTITGKSKSSFFKIMFNRREKRTKLLVEKETKSIPYGDEFFNKIEKTLKQEKHKERFVKLRNLILSSKIILPSEAVLEAINYFSLDEKKEKESDEAYYSRIENIDEFLSFARDFEERSSNKSLKAFLGYINTLMNTKVFNSGEGVKLLTVHSAKGLEFPVVFLVDMVEGIFPYTKKVIDSQSLQEERRLCYVGMTRATDELYVTYCFSGLYSSNQPSRFIKEMVGM